VLTDHWSVCCFRVHNTATHPPTHTHKHTLTQTHTHKTQTHTQTHTDTHTQSQTHTHTNKHTQTHRHTQTIHKERPIDLSSLTSSRDISALRCECRRWPWLGWHLEPDSSITLGVSMYREERAKQSCSCGGVYVRTGSSCTPWRPRNPHYAHTHTHTNTNTHTHTHMSA